ncbi:MAG: isocitrate/isopropylmalate dehydrogenase family protein [SAR202 cluster bacterium]|nr:isocitrate/isopropylmalate dehydrogenase family protein [SAR202 cluster bacterium]
MTSTKTGRAYRVVIIKGDGIGPELVDATLEVMDAVQRKLGTFTLALDFHEGGAAAYRKYGYNLSKQSLEAIRSADACMKGPVGLPDVRLPDGTEAGSLGGVLRNGLDAYANVRPIRLLPGVEAPLKLKPGDIDYVVVRENTEGLYLSRGKGIGNEDAMADTLLMTRKGVERVCRYAFELARKRHGAPADGKQRVTCVDKSNVLASFAFFRRIFDEVGEHYPDIERQYLYADAATQALVMRPQRLDVLVMENFLGDILSDLGGATVGGIGLCPSGNIGDKYAYFEPIHGSAPDIAGQDKASPISQVLSMAMLLDHIGERRAGDMVWDAVSRALETGAMRINNMGQPEGSTKKAAKAIATAVA